jgi:putative membrane protein
MPANAVEAGSAAAQHARPMFLSDHLSNERTYLSYLRTAVSLMSFGIAINRFSVFLVQSNSAPGTPHPASRLVSSERFGIGMVALGMALLVWASIHYCLILRQIERQNFRPNPRGILILTALVLVFGLGGVVWLFIG